MYFKLPAPLWPPALLLWAAGADGHRGAANNWRWRFGLACCEEKQHQEPAKVPVGVDATVFGPEKGRREQVHTLERANACAGEGKCVRLIVLVLLLLRCLHFSLPHLGTAAGFSSWWGGGGGASPQLGRRPSPAALPAALPATKSKHPKNTCTCASTWYNKLGILIGNTQSSALGAPGVRSGARGPRDDMPACTPPKSRQSSEGGGCGQKRNH